MDGERTRTNGNDRNRGRLRHTGSGHNERL